MHLTITPMELEIIMKWSEKPCQPCTCDMAGYCQRHGTYTPVFGGPPEEEVRTHLLSGLRDVRKTYERS